MSVNKTIYLTELFPIISYIIGCQMGRYSLDREGLVYAHEGNKELRWSRAEGAYKNLPRLTQWR